MHDAAKTQKATEFLLMASGYWGTVQVSAKPKGDF